MSSLLREQISVYSESWKKEHQDAMEYWDLQGLLNVGLSLFGWIRATESAWSDAVRSGQRDFSMKDAGEIRSLYEEWLGPCQDVARQIRRLQSMGFEVNGVAQFQEAYLEAQTKVAVNLEDVRAAEKELDEGRGRPLREVVDELRHFPLGHGGK